jgi:hypothetical protein
LDEESPRKRNNEISDIALISEEQKDLGEERKNLRHEAAACLLTTMPLHR